MLFSRHLTLKINGKTIFPLSHKPVESMRTHRNPLSRKLRKLGRQNSCLSNDASLSVLDRELAPKKKINMFSVERRIESSSWRNMSHQELMAIYLTIWHC